MVSVVLVGIFIALCIYRCYKYCFYRPPNFPPGPPRIPLFGSYLFLLLINHKNKFLAINKLCEYYKSSVIGFYTGSFITVVANDPKSVREMLLNQSFDGRNEAFLGRTRSLDYTLKGIFNIDGDVWLHQRRFTLRYLRDFGFGRRYQDYEIEIADEMKSLVNLIKEGPKYEHEKKYFKPGGLVCLPKALIGALGNCFLQACIGHRLARVDQDKVYKAGEGAFDFIVHSNEYGNFFGIAPWIRFFFPEISSFKQCRRGSMDMVEVMKTLIDQQMATYQDGDVRTFLDLYLKEIKDATAKGQKTDFTYDQMIMMCTDFLFPSVAGLQMQIGFLFRHLLHHSDKLKKMQDEIENVVGSGRLPDLDDRVNLPYTEASLREIMRYETVVPSSVAHRATENTTLAGFDIPKDTFALASLHSLNNDKKLWKDPENFRPERFLDFKGNFSKKKDFSLPFSAGRRLCAGETFSRNTMFLCITALLQNFNLETAGDDLPNINDNLCGANRTPKDFWIKLEAK